MEAEKLTLTEYASKYNKKMNKNYVLGIFFLLLGITIGSAQTFEIFNLTGEDHVTYQGDDEIFVLNDPDVNDPTFDLSGLLYLGENYSGTAGDINLTMIISENEKYDLFTTGVPQGSQNTVNISGHISIPRSYFITSNYALIYLRFSNESGYKTISKYIEVHIVPPGFKNNTIGSDQEILEGSTPNKLTGSKATGSYNDFYYQWEKSENNGGWSTINGANGQDYQPGKLTKNTRYRRVVISNLLYVDDHISNTVTISIEKIQNTIALKVVQVPSVANLEGGIPNLSDGSYRYKWQRSYRSGVWIDIPNETGKDYNSIPHTHQRYRRVIVYLSDEYYSNSIFVGFPFTMKRSTHDWNEELTEEGSFNLYPNPVHEEIRITENPKEIEKLDFYDMQGRLAGSTIVDSSTIVVPDTIQNGVYQAVFYFNTDRKPSHKKIVIKR